MSAASQIAVWAAIISACAAIASAGISALMNHTLSRRAASQKIAEMREEWITDLRTHLARFVSICAAGVSAALHGVEQLKEEVQFDYNYIILNLDPGNSQHQRLIKAMTKVMAIASAAIIEKNFTDEKKAKVREEFRAAMAEFTSLSHRILEEEWESLKTQLRNS